MRTSTRSLIRLLTPTLLAAVATAAAAQRFIWPPTAKTLQAPAVAATGADEPTPDVTEAGWQEGAGWQVGKDAVASRPVGATAERPAPIVAAEPDRISWRILQNPNGPHSALFFDPVRQVFAVYHVDSGSGQIMLKSVRKLAADFQLEQFNSSNPAPKDIQAMLDEAR